ncbi:GTP-binding protein [Streptomyces orinoci]|uniref:GTP-binding protein n=1 Tax=Streptomyces orinoci TaxID=67339 RepID=A0ABV3JPQ2_STRON|nr:GTP-binding protein [Streptomyces orinoci]
MAEQQSERTRSTVNVCTLGHMGHGKSTVTVALARVLAKENDTGHGHFQAVDRAPEEQAREGAVDASHVEYDTAARHYVHIDCPKPEDLKGLAEAGARLDAAILVVAAPDGVTAQGREHLRLAREIGIPRVVTFLNKTDLADEGMLDVVETEIRAALTEAGYPGDQAPVVAGSAIRALAEDQARAAIDRLAAALDSYVPDPA